MKKFELTNETKIIYGKKLYRIKALISFGNVTVGEYGGWVEKEENLSQDGYAWIYGNAMVYSNARVYGYAEVYSNAMVYGNAEVYGNAMVYGNADYAIVKGFGSVFRTATFLDVKTERSE